MKNNKGKILNRHDDGVVSKEQTYYFDFDESGRPALYTIDRTNISLREAVEKTHKFYIKFAKQYATSVVENAKPKKKKLAYRQGRSLPVLIGVESKDPLHVKIKKYINHGFNKAIDELESNAKKLVDKL